MAAASTGKRQCGAGCAKSQECNAQTLETHPAAVCKNKACALVHWQPFRHPPDTLTTAGPSALGDALLESITYDWAKSAADSSTNHQFQHRMKPLLMTTPLNHHSRYCSIVTSCLGCCSADKRHTSHTGHSEVSVLHSWMLECKS